MTPQEKFFEFNKKELEEAHKITIRKNACYSPGDNPMSNYDLYGLPQIVGELYNCFQKIYNHERSVTTKGVEPYPFEKLQNACRDAANFCIMYEYYFKEHKKSRK